MGKALKVAGYVAIAASFFVPVPGLQQVGSLAVSVGSGMEARENAAKAARANRQPTEFVAGLDEPLQFPFGRVGTAGKLVYQSTGYGEWNQYTSLVSVLGAAGPIKSFVDFASNDIATGFNPTTQESTGPHNGSMFMSFSLGEQPSSALLRPPGLTNLGGEDMPGWGSSYKLSGKPAVMWTLSEDSKFSEYKGGVEKPLHTIEGRFGWDPRDDDTWPGGMGDCRLDDPTTWVWIENPIIAGLNWAIGMWEGDSGGGAYGVPYACKQVGGIGASLDAIDVASFIEAANRVPEDWTISALPDTGMDESAVLDLMLQAGGAERSRTAGKIACVSFIGEQASLYTLTGADTAGAVEVGLMASRLDRKNTYTAYFVSEPHRWTQTPLSPITDTDWLAEDRGAERSVRVDVPYCRDKDQAAQLGYYALANAREPVQGTAVLKPHLRKIKPGDMMTWSAPGTPLDGRKVVCRTRKLDPMTGQVTITFRSETDAKHDKALAQTGTTAAPPSDGSSGYLLPPTDLLAELSEDGENINVSCRMPADDRVEYVQFFQSTDSTDFNDANPVGDEQVDSPGALVGIMVPAMTGAQRFWAQSISTGYGPARTYIPRLVTVP